MHTNNQTNDMIKWAIVAVDFLLMNVVLLLAFHCHDAISAWPQTIQRLLLFTANLALVIGETHFSPVVHLRMTGAGYILRRIIMLTGTWTLLTYLFMKIVFVRSLPVGRHLLLLGTILFICLLVIRYIERRIVNQLRKSGRNTRRVLFVGHDQELTNVCRLLADEPTRGYRLIGYYADGQMVDREGHLSDLDRLGTVADLLERAKADKLETVDELYLCISRRDRDTIRNISRLCDQRGTHFYYIPVSVESIGLTLNREYLEDIEVYTTYKNPLQSPTNKLLKRSFDIIMSICFLFGTALLLPFIYVIVKLQSPGPLLFRQKRTGLDGHEFYCYKFRSMHVNKDADKVQATKDDPRKYPFGNFMRKSNIDELPQFWNVLKGDMSIVGPRPHMLAHTEQYSQLIDKYMVRHFVKPGVTGWAQVTGFRGETKELWQMEGRVKRDIWYIENWTFWLDLNIIWRTVKTIFVHDDKAY